MIAARNLVKRYDEIVAVDRIDLDVAKGEVFGLLGPNGAGKSTTINMLVGMLKPDAGTITIDGGDPLQPGVRRKIGNAPQSLAIYDDLTAEENLYFFAKLYGYHGRALQDRVKWALDFVELTERRTGRASTYSGGMKRRLNLACAVVHDPPLLLLDEPTVGVDPQSRNLIFERIEQLKGEGRTIVYTTHYMEEAQRLCERVAIIDHGKILALDTVERLLTAHGGVAVVEAELEDAPAADTQLPGVLEGLSLRFESNEPLQEVARLSGNGVRFRTLHLARPDLESVFLNLTGRRLRD